MSKRHRPSRRRSIAKRAKIAKGHALSWRAKCTERGRINAAALKFE